MYSVENVLDALQNYDIDAPSLEAWETALGMSIPTDESGGKRYSPHHINLFKNIKKHLILGRSLSEIRQFIALPPAEESYVEPTLPVESAPVAATPSAAPPRKYASTPPKPSSGGEVFHLVDKLLAEKDQLSRKFTEAEKLNAHLYSANTLFHRKVKELTHHIQTLKEQIKENHNFKLMDDKARLQRQVLELERHQQAKEQEIAGLKRQLHALEQRVTDMQATVDPEVFRGDWLEQLQLLEVCYDNFGVNVEPSRERVFRLNEPPRHCFGHTARVETRFDYETNSLWKRVETQYLGYLTPTLLEGVLVMEYILDGVPVTKAIYRLQCQRHGDGLPG